MKFTVLILAAALMLASASTPAETRKVNSVSHFVITNQGNAYETPAGQKGMFGQIMHATQIEDDGRMASQWCIGQIAVPDENGGIGMVGYCTIIFDNGDVLYTSYIGPGGEGQPNSWTAMGGSGEFAGATGSGTSTIASMRGDGQSFTVQSTGTLTTK